MTTLLSRQAIAPRPVCVVIGAENVGKSQLIGSITKQNAYSDNFAGSTVCCEIYRAESFDFVDTPGIIFEADAETTRLAVDQVKSHDTVLLVVRAEQLVDSFNAFRGLIFGKRAVLALTFIDKVSNRAAIYRALESIRCIFKISAFAVDSRHIDDKQRGDILVAIRDARPFASVIECPSDIISKRNAGEASRSLFAPPLAAVLLLLPAFIAVQAANDVASVCEPLVKDLLVSLTITLKSGTVSIFQEILTGPYGLTTMGPLMLVWALPTVFFYAVLLGIYKASGLLDQLAAAIHPLVRPFGLAGRDLVRVLMGLGCNVPAVVSTRACSRCSRDTCISAISFGSACSYQLGSTLAVFGATGKENLIIYYLMYLVLTTLVFVRLISPAAARSQKSTNWSGRAYLQIPNVASVWRECSGTVKQFLRKALPIFLIISVVASTLNWVHAISAAGTALGSLMHIIGLPPDAAVPIVLASIRKDGILLFASSEVSSKMTAGQLLIGTYFAGVFLPCLVTLFTIIRERSAVFGLRLALRQAIAAIGFTILLAWAVTITGV